MANGFDSTRALVNAEIPSICTGRRRWLTCTRGRIVLLATSLTVVVAASSAPAWANSPIMSFSVSPSTTQAGGHPDIETDFTVGNRDTQNIPAPSCNCQDPKQVTINLPAGVIGDPHSTPQCSQLEFANFGCPSDAQVGIDHVQVGEGGGGADFGALPVYNMVPHTGEAGLLAFHIPLLNFPLFIALNPRTESDYGLKASIVGITHLLPLFGNFLSLWGVPADPSHTAERDPVGCDPFFDEHCSPKVPSNSPLKPFLDNPTSCGESLSASAEVLSYDDGTSKAQASYPATTGCGQLSFNPSLYAQPTTTQTDSASGLAVNLQVPQLESPTVPSPSEIRAVTVTLPEGFSINPNAADGKSSCSELQAQFGTENQAECPEFSEVGTLTLTSSALPGPLTGYIYLGQPTPGDRYRLILSADGFNVHVKLAGSVIPDPQTGQLSISFSNLPETPFEDFDLHIFGSERGILATPTQCGTYAVKSTFTPWDAALPAQSSTQFFALESGPNNLACPGHDRPFAPQVTASSIGNTAGAHSPFSFEVSRSDGDQNLTSLNVTTPPGFSATLKGVAYCTGAALAAASLPAYSGLEEEENPSCPAASQIGIAQTGAGAGTHPVYLQGKVYLAGPYKGAPLSVAVITPAVSGPYDFGNVVVRVALYINPETAQITAVSDPLPQILAGIRLRLRAILIDLDRPNFALNPTNCNPLSVSAEIFGDQGAVTTVGEHFQVANCAALPFAPKLTTTISGSTKHTGFPDFKAVLTANPGEANISSTSLSLPHAEFLENAHIKDPCTRAQFAANQCPAGSLIGYAKAETPLLDRPLEGPVYLRVGSHKLPDIVAVLQGQIDIDLVGHVDSVHERLRTTFEAVPDAPISKFTLSLEGGRKGLLVNSVNLCAHPLHSNAVITGQNGLDTTQTPQLKTDCGKQSGQLRQPQRAQSVHRAMKALRELRRDGAEAWR